MSLNGRMLGCDTGERCTVIIQVFQDTQGHSLVTQGEDSTQSLLGSSRAELFKSLDFYPEDGLEMLVH